VIDAVRRVLEGDPRIAYALLFGSAARGTSHAHSDVDIAVGLARPGALDAPAIGDLTSRLETVSGRPVHVALLDDAPPGLAYRVFRDGRPLLVRDAAAFRARLARAVLEYLDFKPVEDLFTRGVLRAGHGR
jgi:predicted nucleotidyltransferase